jgi:hemolysin III
MSTINAHHARSRSPEFSYAQEAGNAITHGLGAALAVAGLVILVVSAAARGDAWYVAAYSIFGASMVTLYLASTLYHATRAPKLKRILEIFDHAAIFVLIAGSYTAFALTILRHGPGWWIFAAVWSIAAFGITMETLFLNRWPVVTLLAYLAMGWMIVLIWKPFTASAPRLTSVFLIAGGLSYTVGTIFYSLGRRWGWFHIGWHLFVIGGTVCHFFSALAAIPPA